MAKSRHYYIRKTHRYLGLVLGIQFLMWTISGLYFSWSDIDEIHGDFQHRHPPHLTSNVKLVSPDSFLQKLEFPLDSIHTLQLVSVLGKPVYSLQYYAGSALKRALVDAGTGQERDWISREEAIGMAAESFIGDPKVKRVEFLMNTDRHHEYREKPLPAWAISFDHPTNTTVYVSSEIGKVESFRNDKWRLFDFLWMGHTMDYKGRDDFNNWLLRIFSAFGLVTILSGFVLFWVTRRRRRREW